MQPCFMLTSTWRAIKSFSYKQESNRQAASCRRGESINCLCNWTSQIIKQRPSAACQLTGAHDYGSSLNERQSIARPDDDTFKRFITFELIPMSTQRWCSKSEYGRPVAASILRLNSQHALDFAYQFVVVFFAANRRCLHDNGLQPVFIL